MNRLSALLIRPFLKAVLVIMDKFFQLTRKKSTPHFPYDKRTSTITLPSEVEKELRRLISTGNKVEAIKRVTKLTGAGLRVSKDYVDSLPKRSRSRH
jgi:ribosomal protein L7/L12